MKLLYSIFASSLVILFFYTISRLIGISFESVDFLTGWVSCMAFYISRKMIMMTEVPKDCPYKKHISEL